MEIFPVVHKGFKITKHNTRIHYIKHGKHIVDIIRKPNQKIFKYGMYPKRRKNNQECHNEIKIWGV